MFRNILNLLEEKSISKGKYIKGSVSSGDIISIIKIKHPTYDHKKIKNDLTNKVE